MRDFCDDPYNETEPENGHDPDLPNRHNALCDGRSTWTVVSLSEEIVISDGVQLQGAPEFEILRPDQGPNEDDVRAPHIVMVLH